MVLQTGKLGIKQITNSHNGGDRQAISINPNTRFGEAGTMLLKDDTIIVGYNENIICESEELALELFIILDGVLSVGEEAAEVVPRVEDAVSNIFLQTI